MTDYKELYIKENKEDFDNFVVTFKDAEIRKTLNTAHLNLYNKRHMLLNTYCLICEKFNIVEKDWDIEHLDFALLFLLKDFTDLMFTSDDIKAKNELEQRIVKYITK